MHKSQYILFWCDSSDKIASAYDKLQLSFLLIMKCAFPQYLLPYDSSDIPSILKAFRVFVMFEVKLCSLLKEFRTNAFYIISISKTENKISQLRNMISSFCRTERKKIGILGIEKYFQTAYVFSACSQCWHLLKTFIISDDIQGKVNACGGISGRSCLTLYLLVILCNLHRYRYIYAI